jgi:hypothetical protein
VVNRLGRSPEYEGKVLWLEHFVDDNADTRRRRWWIRKQADDPDATRATTPLILVDSGRTFSDGLGQPFEPVYRGLVDEALTEPPHVAIDASFLRDRGGNRVMVAGTITNTSSVTLGYDNEATLWLMAFEEEQVIHVDWFVRSVASFGMDEDLAPGATSSFDEMLQLTPSTDIEAVQIVVMVEFRSEDVDGAFKSANAALALSAEVAPEPSPTLPPSETAPLYLPAARR